MRAVPPASRKSAPEPRTTRTEALRQQLADAIASGALEPGTPLDEADLARQYGVSRTPVREAIRNLAASGLVDVRPHRGAVVALPTPSRLADMFRAMAELEGLCAGLAAETMTTAEKDKLRKLHELMAALVEDDDAERYRAQNDRFHSALYEGAHNSYLAEMAKMTRTRVSPFRHVQFNRPGRLKQSHHEHGLIVAAIMNGDRISAATLAHRHIDIVRDVYRNLLPSQNAEHDA